MDGSDAACPTRNGSTSGRASGASSAALGLSAWSCVESGRARFVKPGFCGVTANAPVWYALHRELGHLAHVATGPRMTEQRILPRAPNVELQLVEDLTPQQPRGFLRLVRRRLVAIGPDGERSEPFIYDEVDRAAIDAVVVAAYFYDPVGAPRVYLRSATRPPVALRQKERHPDPELAERGGLWELVAGLVEEAESTSLGIVQCAKRELAEELGFDVDTSALHSLGLSTLPAPGVIGERHFYYCVEVDPMGRRSPDLDGSVLERLGVVLDIPLRQALRACDNGEIEDAKTELGLRRLWDRLEQNT